MSLRKPFKAVPIKPGPQYKQVQARANDATPQVPLLLLAALLGPLFGLGSLAFTPEGRDQLEAGLKPAAVAAGIVRARSPQPGDHWGGCNDARAAGTAPIYSSEPGYREDMDGDGDGIACEPNRGY